MLREIITFEVQGQLFGLDIMSIREIRAWSAPTPLPKVPDYVAGVINLRGNVLPVFDLASRLGWSAADVTPRHAIVVAHLGDQLRGLIVDRVCDIVEMDDNCLQQASASDGGIAGCFLEGIISLDDAMIMILDLQSLANEDIQIPIEQAQLEEIA